jgi:hypothetical protein
VLACVLVKTGECFISNLILWDDWIGIKWATNYMELSLL